MSTNTRHQERRQREREREATLTHQINATGNVAIVEGIPIPWRWIQTINLATWGPDPNLGLAVGLWAWAGFNGFKLPTASWDDID